MEVRAHSWSYFFMFTLLETGLCSLVFMSRLELKHKLPFHFRSAGISDTKHLDLENSSPYACVVYHYSPSHFLSQMHRT